MFHGFLVTSPPYKGKIWEAFQKNEKFLVRTADCAKGRAGGPLAAKQET
jgi:hypothetical protein